MSDQFPRLKGAAGVQYPVTREVRCATRVLRFVDGSEQRFRERAAERRWRVDLALIDEQEAAAAVAFFETRQGRAGSFDYGDAAGCRFGADEMEMVWEGEGRCSSESEIREGSE